MLIYIYGSYMTQSVIWVLLTNWAILANWMVIQFQIAMSMILIHFNVIFEYCESTYKYILAYFLCFGSYMTQSAVRVNYNQLEHFE